MSDKIIKVPLLVNVLKGCKKDDPSDEQIKKWIKEAKRPERDDRNSRRADARHLPF